MGRKSLISTSFSSSSFRTGCVSNNYKLELPEDTFVGRDEELKTLRSLFLRTKEGKSAVVAIKGREGTGKSKLIQVATSRGIFDQDSLFVRATYNARQRNEPFSGIVEAISQLLKRLQRRGICRDTIRSFLASVRSDLLLLYEVLPALFELADMNEADIAKMCVAKDGSGSFVMKNNFLRLTLTLHKLLSFLCKPPHQSVVMALEDIQNMDQASIDFVSFLLEESMASFTLEDAGNKNKRETMEIRGLFLLLSFRVEEISPDHKLVAAIDALRAPQISLESLDEKLVNELVASWVKRSSEDTAELAQVVFRKTGGDPFSVEKYIEVLSDEGLLYFDAVITYNWTWKDPDEIEKTTGVVSKNVAELIVKSMQRKLSEELQQVLMVAACLGMQVPLSILEAYFSDESSDNMAALKADQVENFLLQAVDLGVLSHPQPTVFVWSHERVQEAAYSMLRDDEQQVQLRMATLLWNMTENDSRGAPDWLVFLAAEQVNRAIDAKSEKMLGYNLGRLNLRAARLCVTKSAYYPAFDLLMLSTKALGSEQSRWKDYYQLCLDVQTLLAEVSFYLGKFVESEAAVNEVLRHADNPDDTFQVELMQANAAGSGVNRDYQKQLQLYVNLMRKQGGSDANFPTKVNKVRLGRESLTIRQKYKKTWRDLDPKQELMTDKKALRRVSLIVKISMVASSMGDHAMADFCGQRLTRLVFDYGLTVHIVTALVWPCLRLRREKKYKELVERYTLAQKMRPRFEGMADYSRSMCSLHFLVMPLVQPFHDSLDAFSEGHQARLAVGDIEFAFAVAMCYGIVYVDTGLRFAPLGNDMANYIDLAKRLRIPDSIQAVLKILHQSVLNLQGQADDSNNPTKLNGSAMNEDEMLRGLKDSSQYEPTLRDLTSLRLMLSCIFFDRDAMETNLVILSKFDLDDKFFAREFLRRFYLGLSATILTRVFKKQKHAKMADKIRKLFMQQVEEGCPNAYPALLMMQAFDKQTEDSFQAAIVACARSGLLSLEAMTREGLGRMLLSTKDAKAGEAQMHIAMERYDEVDASAKVSMLKDEFSFLCDSLNSRSGHGSSLKARPRYDPLSAKKLEQVDISLDIGMGQ